MISVSGSWIGALGKECHMDFEHRQRREIRSVEGARQVDMRASQISANFSQDSLHLTPNHP